MTYKETLEIARKLYEETWISQATKDALTKDIPELKESEDEKIRKWLIGYFQRNKVAENIKTHDILAWLEKQGEESSWKPSKEEMDVLYGLAYITNQYDEQKEEVITRLYQDLKREFFNGSSYENMFPNTEDSVRRRSTIQVLEYARSLDIYNQYGKADIDKNIAWLEKQGEQKPFDYENTNIQQKDFASIDPKFHEGEWIVNNDSGGVYQVIRIRDDEYCLWPLDAKIQGYLRIIDVDNEYHLWTIQDAKPGDVLVCDVDKRPLIFKGLLDSDHPNCPVAYCGIDTEEHFRISIGIDWWTDDTVCPATKEQRDLLFSKMKEAGYEWDADKKELKKIEQKSAWSKEDERLWHSCIAHIEDELEQIRNDKYGHSEIISDLKESCRERIKWLKSIKERIGG